MVDEFVREPEDRLCLIREGLRMVGFMPVGSLEALVDDLGAQTQSAAAQALSDALID